MAYYIKQLYDFLDALAANNNRPWFNEHKELYKELRDKWLADVDRMIGLMAAGGEPALASQTARAAAYRIYRDTRFSHDKTPYKTHFSAALSPTGRRDCGAGYYLQIGGGNPDEGLYAGIWCPPSDQLKKLRRAIVDNIEEFEAILAEPAFAATFTDWVGDTLKTIPQGYDRHHPLAHLLRRKDYGRSCPEGRTFFLDPSWPEKAAERMLTAVPFVKFINYSLFEEE
ncbi:MAG: DUF2461 domain-containing protein [Candidatus Amulumruptor caecigallinarius]|nr:DUF2461 domain-containing protein [Candidatus Amulumruptor caecigallinarius]MCM1397079.1 DUF2461 domain-containing protein [Candidatus Amulumruptor caecigallinarius]MCM1454065.1 DUF2461 domain-containing protein [bacterium]